MRALVLSGGGANGEYQVGALQHVIGELGVKYDAFCGVSVGALNGAYLAQFGHDLERKGVEMLESLWDQIDDDAIFKKWWGGVLGNLPGILFKDSVYNTEPIRKMTRRHLDSGRLKASGKKLRVGAVAWGSGEYRSWTENDSDIEEGVMASSAFPIFFEDVMARGVLWADGGLRNITPLKSAIELGATRIDVIRCASGNIEAAERKRGKLSKIQRMIEILLDEVERGDLARAHDINDFCSHKGGEASVNGKERRFIDIRVLAPKSSLGDSLDFDPVKNRNNRNRGYRDASEFTWV
jgi:NTE family protein